MKHTAEKIAEIIGGLEAKLTSLLDNPPTLPRNACERISLFAQNLEGRIYLREVAFYQGEIDTLKMIRLQGVLKNE